MGPKLILLDLDGTLLRQDKSLAAATQEALERAAGRGAEIVIATGRTFTGVPRELRELPFLRYFILMNGAKIYDRREDRVIRRVEIPMERAEQVFDLMATVDVAPDCYQNDVGLISRHYFERLDYYVPTPESRKMIRANRTPLDDFRGTVRARGDSVQKLQCHFHDRSLRPALMARLAEEFPELELSVSLPDNLEINQPGATKGDALVFLCGELGIDIRESAAFGDGTNDVSMIRAAGTGVAMANAAPEVLAAADLTAPSNQEDGVARILNQWFEE